MVPNAHFDLSVHPSYSLAFNRDRSPTSSPTSPLVSISPSSRPGPSMHLSTSGPASSQGGHGTPWPTGPTHSASSSMPQQPHTIGKRNQRETQFSFKNGSMHHTFDVDKAPYPVSYDRHILELCAQILVAHEFLLNCFYAPAKLWIGSWWDTSRNLCRS